jgi:hypothetical protein
MFLENAGFLPKLGDRGISIAALAERERKLVVCFCSGAGNRENNQRDGESRKSRESHDG